MSQYRKRAINIINRAQYGASITTKQGVVKKKNTYLFQHLGHAIEMDSEYLENYVSIYSHINDLRQGVVL